MPWNSEKFSKKGVGRYYFLSGFKSQLDRGHLKEIDFACSSTGDFLVLKSSLWKPYRSNLATLFPIPKVPKDSLSREKPQSGQLSARTLAMMRPRNQARPVRAVWVEELTRQSY